MGMPNKAFGMALTRAPRKFYSEKRRPFLQRRPDACTSHIRCGFSENWEAGKMRIRYPRYAFARREKDIQHLAKDPAKTFNLLQ